MVDWLTPVGAAEAAQEPDQLPEWEVKEAQAATWEEPGELQTTRTMGVEVAEAHVTWAEAEPAPPMAAPQPRTERGMAQVEAVENMAAQEEMVLTASSSWSGDG